MMQNKIALVIETTTNTKVFGRINYEDNLIISSARNIASLEKK